MKIINSFLKFILNKNGYYFGKNTKYKCLNILAQKYYPIKLNNFSLIRVGRKGDGGYLIPNCFDGINECFSPGVGYESSFEIGLLNFGIKSHLLDNSVKLPSENFEYLSFTNKKISSVDSIDSISLDSWVENNSLNNFNDLILQMDIEGSEYGTILAANSTTLNRFRIIVIELHNLEWLKNKIFFDLFNEFTLKLLNNHTVVHLHPNNNQKIVKVGKFEVHPTLEITLLRNDYIKDSDLEYCTKFPNILDHECLDYKSEVFLSNFWYKKVLN